MIFQAFIEEDLGHVSYIFGDDISKEVVIVDPKRDIDDYIKYLKKNDLELKYILNTHTHADYIGGHLELVNVYPKAKNIFHKSVPSQFDFIKVEDGDLFNLGNLKFQVLETPGHTPFCISAIINEDGIDKYIFTGDILFVGDIARPDLLGQELLEDLLNMSYNSAKKLWNLSNDIIIFTSHIKGSFCGKDLKNQYFSTIGIEKKTNISFILSQKSQEEYINNLKSQNIEIPSFFKKMAIINIKGPKFLKELKDPIYLKEKDFFNLITNNDFIIDFRHPNAFKTAYIRDSINVYEYSNIILIIGSLIDINTKLFFVGDRNTKFDIIIKKLRRIGFDNIEAILDEDVNELKNLIKFEEKDYSKTLSLNPSEEVGDINCEISEVKNLDIDENYNVICENGYKSMAVKSFLVRKKDK